MADTDDREPDARESCPYCMGSGWYHECGEDSCCCADPDDPCGPYAFDCEECDGLGELPIYDMPPPASRDGAAKGGEKEATQGTCSRCGYLAMPPACTKCYSPYPAPAPRDGGAKGGSEGGERG